MMRKIISNFVGHNLPIKRFPKSSDFICTTCATGKLIIKPSHLKFKNETLNFLERIQGEICSPIPSLSGPFRYFVVLIDASTRWSHVCLLSTCNHTFAKLIAQPQIIKLRSNHREHRIKTIRMDNVGKFSSRAFNDYCMALGIHLELLCTLCSFSKRVG
jgi:hypothetical protein